MADYSNFMSTGTTYEFSKGPKSLYYANGDEDLFGVVLNVPQQDDDDEWGGTERIALERTADAIGTLQATLGVTDTPSGYGIGNGVVKKLSDIMDIVDVNTGDIAANNGVFSGDIKADEITATTITGTTVVAGSATMCGTLTTRALIPDSGYTLGGRNIGTPSVRYNGIAAVSLNLDGDIVADTITVSNVNATSLVAGEATMCGTLTTRALIPDSGYTLGGRNIGTPSVRYNGIAAVSLNLSEDITARDITLSGDISAVNGSFSGDIGVDDIIADEITTATLVAGTANVCGILTTRAIAPDADGTRSIGGPFRYSVIWANNLNLSQDIEARHTTLSGNISAVNGVFSGDIYTTEYQTYTATIYGWDPNPTTRSVYWKKVGKTVIVYLYVSGVSSNPLTKVSLPATCSSGPDAYIYCVDVVDSGSAQATPGKGCIIPAYDSNYVFFTKAWNSNPLSGDFTASGTKTLRAVIIYQAA